MVRSFSQMLLAGWLVASAAVPGAAAPLARQHIQAAYDKSTEAADLRYLQGALSVRMPDFFELDRNGKRLDALNQLAIYRRIFSDSLAINETVEIKSFEQKDSRHAQCIVHDVMQITMPASRGDTDGLVTIDTISLDSWELAKRGWCLSSSAQRQQKVSNKALAPNASPPKGEETPLLQREPLPWSRERVAVVLGGMILTGCLLGLRLAGRRRSV